MQGVIDMIPTKEVTMRDLEQLNENDYKKVVIYISNLKSEDKTATVDQVSALSKKFNSKYAAAFRALAK